MAKNKLIEVTQEMIEAAFPVYLDWEATFVDCEENGASSEAVMLLIERVLKVSLEVCKHPDP